MDAVLLLIPPLIPEFVQAQYKLRFPAMSQGGLSCDGVLLPGPANWFLMIRVSFLEYCSLDSTDVKSCCPLRLRERKEILKGLVQSLALNYNKC